jgi:hypothetical protein
MTIPKPFNLVTAAKRVIKESAKDPKSPFVPLAIKLQTFEKDIAERANPKVSFRKNSNILFSLLKESNRMLNLHNQYLQCFQLD